MALPLICPLHESLGHTKSCQSSLVVSWQRICNSLTVTTAHTKSSLHKLTFVGQMNWTQCQVKVTLRLTILFLWGALSDERTGLSFVYAAGSCQRSLSRIRVAWDSRPYFTVSDLRLPFSSPPTTRRVTVEVFDPAFTRVTHSDYWLLLV
jgi:hypothetical protein